MKLVLLGPPGAGKGTLSGNLVKELGFLHLSAGDMLRSEMKKGSEIGKKAKSFVESGTLVPDDLIIDMMINVLDGEDNKVGIILDGFPRTVAQAEALDKKMKPDLAVNISTPYDIIIKRLSGRLLCKNCGAIYNTMSYDKDTCEKCGGELYQRDDDKPETVANRLKVYEEQSKPLIDYYKNQGILNELDGSKDSKVLVGEFKKIMEMYK